MNYHVVRINDSIEKIASIYNLTINEIKNLNTHISNWKELIPGTRIKLPTIPDSINEELNDIEPFIEDYYPKIDIKKYESKDMEEQDKIDVEELNTSISETNDNLEVSSNLKQEENEKINNSEPVKISNTINLPPNYNYYYPFYDYQRYYYQNRKRKS